MGFPKIKRVNTIGIRFTKGERDESHYFEIINNILDIPRNQIYGIAEMGPKRFMVKLNTFSTYDRVVKDYVGTKLSIDDDYEFEVDDLSTYKNRVRRDGPKRRRLGGGKVILTNFCRISRKLTNSRHASY